MYGYRAPSAGPHSTLGNMADMNMDSEMTQPPFSAAPHMQHVQHQPEPYEQSPIYNQHSGQWPVTNTEQQQFVHQQHLFASSFSSGIPSSRSSDSSVFAQHQFRYSTSSSSVYSYNSDFSQDQNILQSEYLLNHNSSYAPSPVEGPTSPAPRKRPTQPKDPFKTCVSVNKQCRPCDKVHKYFCTSCSKLFVEKADWKRHEETYQERTEMFKCDRCTAIYFLDRDFATHHSKSHHCDACKMNLKCSEKPHVQRARKKRLGRTGWGCGFCCHFSVNWTERCNHVAYHIENDNKTVADWHHSCVINSLLQRPTVNVEWTKLLQSKRRRFMWFAWNSHSTGRVEGYPESNQKMQLQDRLEYYTPDQDAVALAQLAYDKLLRDVAHPESPEVPSIPPPVPPKDYYDHQATLLEDLRRETESWTQLMNSIIEDDNFPTGITLLEEWHAE